LKLSLPFAEESAMSVATQSCPYCQKSFPVPASQAGLMVTCPGCGRAVPQGPAVAPRWFFAQGNQRFGPISLDDLRGRAAAAQIRPDTMVIQEGASRWAPAGSIPDLLPPPQPAGSMPAPTPSPTATPAAASGLGRVQRILMSGLQGTRLTAFDTASETRRRVRLGRLRRRLRNLHNQYNKLANAVGVQVLSGNAVPPECAELAEKFRSLNAAFNLAQQGALAGDKDQKNEARRLATELRNLYVVCGRLMLAVGGPAGTRPDWARRHQDLTTAIERTDTEARDLEGKGAAVDPKIRRRSRVGFGIMAVLALLGLGLYARHLFRSPFASDDVKRAAGEALVASETRLRTLEGKALTETKDLLTTPDARSEAMKGGDKEEALRAYLHSKRSDEARADARAFLDGLNAESRHLVTANAERLKMKPEDLVLDWLTYEGVLDYFLMTRLWNQWGKVKGDTKKEIDKFFDDVTDAPGVKKGSAVREQSADKVVIDLFGAHFVGEVAGDQPARLNGDQVLLPWKSNYRYVRDLFKGQAPRAIFEEPLTREHGAFKSDYQGWLNEYLSGGEKQPWATAMFEDAELTKVATLAHDDPRITGKIPAAALTGPHPSLEELNVRLSPAAPAILLDDDPMGSGFLLEHKGRLLVVTNRHVVNNPNKGISVQFMKSNERNQEVKLTVPASQTTVVAVHRVADLALLDVTPAAAEIKKWGVEPMTLAPPAHVPEVGEDVAAIGHPGTGKEGPEGVLTRTLSKGIVSAVHRTYEGVRALQITAQINKGNSGGPLFDQDGRVVGVNTWSIRMIAGGRYVTEGLNLSIEVFYVHELLNDPSKSLDAAAIARMVKWKDASEVKAALKAEVDAAQQEWRDKGYRLIGDAAFEARESDTDKTANLPRGKRYTVVVVQRGVPNMSVLVGDPASKVIAASMPGPRPSVTFETGSEGVYIFRVHNPSSEQADVVLLVFEQAEARW
jgi:S1-C subfamily serine protease